MYADPRTANYQNLVSMIAKNVMGGQHPKEGALSMTIIAEYKIPKVVPKTKRQLMVSNILKPTKKPDLDNVIKIISDGLNGIVFFDDSQIATIHAHKCYGEVPRVKVWVSDRP
jgi:Holliday junction resolvase RusA-like endonuclease